MNIRGWFTGSSKVPPTSVSHAQQLIETLTANALCKHLHLLKDFGETILERGHAIYQAKMGMAEQVRRWPEIRGLTGMSLLIQPPAANKAVETRKGGNLGRRDQENRRLPGCHD